MQETYEPTERWFTAHREPDGAISTPPRVEVSELKNWLRALEAATMSEKEETKLIDGFLPKVKIVCLTC